MPSPVKGMLLNITHFFINKTAIVCYMFNMKNHKNPHAVALGGKGGKKTAKRSTEYYREIAAMRKSFKGGRLRKKA